jgi:hypothetical protein
VNALLVLSIDNVTLALLLPLSLLIVGVTVTSIGDPVNTVEGELNPDKTTLETEIKNVTLFELRSESFTVNVSG